MLLSLPTPSIVSFVSCIKILSHTLPDVVQLCYPFIRLMRVRAAAIRHSQESSQGTHKYSYMIFVDKSGGGKR
jgi:hypothetical protein